MNNQVIPEHRNNRPIFEINDAESLVDWFDVIKFIDFVRPLLQQQYIYGHRYTRMDQLVVVEN